MNRLGHGAPDGGWEDGSASGDSEVEPACPAPGPIFPEMLAQEVMLRYPATVVVFRQFGLPCPGCLASGYESIAQVSLMLDMPLATLLAVLNQAAVRHSAPRPRGSGWQPTLN